MPFKDDSCINFKSKSKLALSKHDLEAGRAQINDHLDSSSLESADVSKDPEENNQRVAPLPKALTDWNASEKDDRKEHVEQELEDSQAQKLPQEAKKSCLPEKI